VHFVTVANLEEQPTEAVLGFEQHGFGVAVLRVQCNPALDEPVYFPPCTGDPDLALVLLPGEWLTETTLVEAARTYLCQSREWGPVQGSGEDVCVHRWVPVVSRHRGDQGEDGVRVFLHPEGELTCKT
jgi:hypothetical protein